VVQEGFMAATACRYDQMDADVYPLSHRYQDRI